MSTVSSVLRRAPRQLMFWLIIAVFAAGALRAFFPIEGFDEVRTGEVPSRSRAVTTGSGSSTTPTTR